MDKWKNSYSSFLSIKNNELVKKISILATGTGLAQIFPIVSLPFITRIYTPEEFGTYSIYYSFVTLISVFALLEYSNVILIEKDDTIAVNGLGLSIVINLFCTLLLVLLFAYIPEYLIVSFLGTRVIPFLQIIPVTVFLIGINTILYRWFLRKEDYKLLAKNKVILGASTMIFQIGIGLFRLGTWGFVLANLLGYFLSTILLVWRFKKYYSDLFCHMKFKSFVQVAREHFNFPLYTMPASLINTFSSQIPDYFINKYFGASIVGYYSLGQRMISLPLSFVSSSIQDVFRQTATKEFSECGSIKNSFRKMLKIEIWLAIPFLIALISFVPELFVLFFGKQWIESGSYVRILSFLFMIRFVSSPLSYVWLIRKKQTWDLFWQIGLLLLTIMSFFISYFVFHIIAIKELLIVYTAVISLWYFINIKVSHHFSNQVNGIF